jgi:formylglycine-generating enzyme required for sulfatase activity
VQDPEQRSDTAYHYDAFVSYHETDAQWVEAHLLPRLRAAGIRWIDQRRFVPGRPLMGEMERAMQESSRTVLVLTRSYLEDRWSEFDSLLAASYGLMTGKWRMIPVIRESCLLPPRLRALVPVELMTDDAYEWERLLCALRPSREGESRTTAPTEAPVATVPIPDGEFWMGAAEHDSFAFPNESPALQVFLPAYRIGRYPVTNAQYALFVQATGHFPPEHWTGQDSPHELEMHPVVNVSYADAVSFCRWLSGKARCHFRLPTEEEWERAARGNDWRVYPWGDEWSGDRCNTSEANIGQTVPVGEYDDHNQSPFGVCDMAGNAAEWTMSWYLPYPGSTTDSWAYGRTHRVVRGGSWRHDARWARVSCRGRYKPAIKRSHVGFRVVLQEF